MFSKGSVFKALMLSVAVFIIHPLHAQDFQAIGLRLGAGAGFVYKTYLDYENAFELIAYNKEKGALLTGLYFYNDPVSKIFSDRFFFHYGFGGHIGYYRETEYYKVIDGQGNEVTRERKVSYPNLGLDVLAGIEYRLETYPLIVSFDFKPTLNFFGPYKKIGSNIFDFGISILYKI